jgi:flavin-dependent dehydrogenase
MLVVVLCVLMTTLTLTTAFNHSPWPSTLSSSRARVLRMGETREVDVAVIGAGVGGMTISWMLAERENLETALIDPQVESGSWYPNYGSWSKEWDALSAKLDLPELKQCLTNEWEYTDCFFGGSNDVPMTQRTTLQQPYVRVDKKKMRDLYLSRFKASGNGVTIPSKLTTRCIGPNLFESEKIHHADTHTLLTLDNGDVVKCKVVIDATGPESSLVAREDPVYARGGGAPELQTGYQIAYGFVAHVDSTYSALLTSFFSCL